jgi:hypothetical protein
MLHIRINPSITYIPSRHLVTSRVMIDANNVVQASTFCPNAFAMPHLKIWVT